MRTLPLIVFLALLIPGTAAAATAPGAPGQRALWTPADRDGLGTAHNTTRHAITLTDKRSLTYRQVTSTPRYRIVKTYVTDPARNALLIDVRFRSRTGRKLALYALADPALSNNGNDDSGRHGGSDD